MTMAASRAMSMDRGASNDRYDGVGLSPPNPNRGLPINRLMDQEPQAAGARPQASGTTLANNPRSEFQRAQIVNDYDSPGRTLRELDEEQEPAANSRTRQSNAPPNPGPGARTGYQQANRLLDQDPAGARPSNTATNPRSDFQRTQNLNDYDPPARPSPSVPLRDLDAMEDQEPANARTRQSNAPANPGPVARSGSFPQAANDLRLSPPLRDFDGTVDQGAFRSRQVDSRPSRDFDSAADQEASRPRQVSAPTNPGPGARSQGGYQQDLNDRDSRPSRDFDPAADQEASRPRQVSAPTNPAPGARSQGGYQQDLNDRDSRPLRDFDSAADQDALRPPRQTAANAPTNPRAGIQQAANNARPSPSVPLRDLDPVSDREPSRTRQASPPTTGNPGPRPGFQQMGSNDSRPSPRTTVRDLDDGGQAYVKPSKAAAGDAPGPPSQREALLGDALLGELRDNMHALREGQRHEAQQDVALTDALRRIEGRLGFLTGYNNFNAPQRPLATPNQTGKYGQQQQQRVYPEIVYSGEAAPANQDAGSRSKPHTPLTEDQMSEQQSTRLAQMAMVDQQRELMRYMRGLNEWLERDVQDRQMELRSVAARVDQLAQELRSGLLSGLQVHTPEGDQPPALLHPSLFGVPFIAFNRNSDKLLSPAHINLTLDSFCTQYRVNEKVHDILAGEGFGSVGALLEIDSATILETGLKRVTPLATQYGWAPVAAYPRPTCMNDIAAARNSALLPTMTTNSPLHEIDVLAESSDSGINQASNLNSDATRLPLGDAANAQLLQRLQEMEARLQTAMEKRSRADDDKFAELKAMFQRILDERDVLRSGSANLNAGGARPNLEEKIEDLSRQNAEQRELLTALLDETNKQHKSTRKTMRSSAQEQVEFNLRHHLDEFNKKLAFDVRFVLGEIQKRSEELDQLKAQRGWLQEECRVLEMKLASLRKEVHKAEPSRTSTDANAPSLPETRRWSMFVSSLSQKWRARSSPL
uniref:Uncharacterized protein n=1 Tax=Mycena chlorophos TaxID=658473 RepID=A0ABQ0M1X1_MYCCL|nr:predicted protein [Mycena chlorophos]